MYSMTLPEIESAYTKACLEAGDLQYRITAMRRSLDAINQRLLDLNVKAEALKATEQSQ